MKTKIYTAQQLQRMYDNQNELTYMERRVLDVAMWHRARRANYHGYAKDWKPVMTNEVGIYVPNEEGEYYLHTYISTNQKSKS